MDSIKKYFEELHTKLIVDNDLLEMITPKIKKQKSILDNLNNILNSDSQFKLMELEMWLKNFGFGPKVEDFINAGFTKQDAEEFCNELKLFAFKIKENGGMRDAALNDYIEIFTLKDNYIKINDVEIYKNGKNDIFTVKEKNEFLGKVDLSKWEEVKIEEEFSLKEPGKDAEFGVYFFDPSTGFDPDRLTSSFIVWIGGGKGMVVDPLTNLPQYFDRKRINRNDIKYVFLTHVHSDHDDGLLEEIKKTV